MIMPAISIMKLVPNLFQDCSDAESWTVLFVSHITRMR